MKKSFKLFLPSLALILTMFFVLLPSKTEAKSFGNEVENGPCQSTGGTTGGIRAVTTTLYIFWIPVQSSTVYVNC